MRKFCLLLVLACALCACGSKKEPQKTRGLSVLSTTAMIDDLVARIGGERIEHATLIIGAIDPHSYELVKGDSEKIEEARVVFFNGLNLEHGASLNYKLSSHSHAISLGDFLLFNYPELILREQNQVVDPHIWMDVSLWAKVIDPIVEALSKEDPEGSVYYEAQGEALKEEMVAFHRSLKSQLASIPEEKRYLVTSHDAFGYFARGYLATEEELAEGSWRKRCMAPEGLAPDGQIGSRSLQRVIDHLIENQIAVVFPESNVNVDSLRKIVSACAKKQMVIRFSLAKLYGDAMGEKNSSASTYFGMLEHNAKTLIEEWK